jgi:hypothetical protein
VPDDIARAKYISFVSRRSNGTPVATPVWVVPFEDGIAFTTEPDAHKVRRVRRDPAVTVAACTFRGAVAPDAPVHAGRAEILDPQRARQVDRLVARKYRLGYVAITVAALWRRLRGRRSEDGAIKVVFGPS